MVSFHFFLQKTKKGWREILVDIHPEKDNQLRFVVSPADTAASIAYLQQVSLKIIRIFHGCEVRIEKSVRGSLFGIRRLCRVMLNSDPEGRIFLSALNNHDRFFFLHILWSSAFDLNIWVAIKQSRWHPPYWKLTSYVTSQWRQLTASSR